MPRFAELFSRWIEAFTNNIGDISSIVMGKYSQLFVEDFPLRKKSGPAIGRSDWLFAGSLRNNQRDLVLPIAGLVLASLNTPQEIGMYDKDQQIRICACC